MYPSSITTVVDAQRRSRQSKRGSSAAPSAKAQEIFRRVVVACEKQSEVAEDLKISPGRVSQHVRRVRRWLAQGSPGNPEATTHEQQQRLERSIAKARHQELLALAMCELRRLAAIHRHATTRIEEKEGENTKVVTTYRDQALSVQHMKIAQKAIIELQKLAELDPLPEPAAAIPSDHELFRALRDVLCHWRQRAEHAGHVAQSNWEELVGAVLAAVLGRNDDPLPPDDAVREFLENLLRGNQPSGPGAENRVAQTGDADAGWQPSPDKPSPDKPSQDGDEKGAGIVPPEPHDSNWRPFVTGLAVRLAPPLVRHPDRVGQASEASAGPPEQQGSGVKGQESGKSGTTERQSDGETEGIKSPDSLSPSLPLSVSPSSVSPSSVSAPLQTPKDTSAPLPGTQPPQPPATNSTSTTSSNASASSASSAVSIPPADEKTKIFTPYPPITLLGPLPPVR